MGGGLNWQSKIYAEPEIPGEVGIAASQQKAYTTVDLMAQYRTVKKLRIGLHANNLFNQEYRTVPNMLSYGAPRSIMATFRYEF